jgi:hypothetical protein
MNDNFAPAIARTGCRLIARHNGRAFAVAVPANFPSPAVSLSFAVGGAGAVLLDCEAAPAADFAPFHECG